MEIHRGSGHTIDRSLPLIPCQLDEFNQPVLNLIVNAAHAIGDIIGENGLQKGRTTIETRNCPAWAEIRIQDTGAGIPESVRARSSILYLQPGKWAEEPGKAWPSPTRPWSTSTTALFTSRPKSARVPLSSFVFPRTEWLSRPGLDRVELRPTRSEFQFGKVFVRIR
jgi:hypothetical protein